MTGPYSILNNTPCLHVVENEHNLFMQLYTVAVYPGQDIQAVMLQYPQQHDVSITLALGYNQKTGVLFTTKGNSTVSVLNLNTKFISTFNFAMSWSILPASDRMERILLAWSNVTNVQFQSIGLIYFIPYLLQSDADTHKICIWMLHHNREVLEPEVHFQTQFHTIGRDVREFGTVVRALFIIEHQVVLQVDFNQWFRVLLGHEMHANQGICFHQSCSSVFAQSDYQYRVSQFWLPTLPVHDEHVHRQHPAAVQHLRGHEGHNTDNQNTSRFCGNIVQGGACIPTSGETAQKAVYNHTQASDMTILPQKRARAEYFKQFEESHNDKSKLKISVMVHHENVISAHGQLDTELHQPQHNHQVRPIGVIKELDTGCKICRTYLTVLGQVCYSMMTNMVMHLVCLLSTPPVTPATSSYEEHTRGVTVTLKKTSILVTSHDPQHLVLVNLLHQTLPDISPTNGGGSHQLLGHNLQHVRVSNVNLHHSNMMVLGTGTQQHTGVRDEPRHNDHPLLALHVGVQLTEHKFLKPSYIQLASSTSDIKLTLGLLVLPKTKGSATVMMTMLALWSPSSSRMHAHTGITVSTTASQYLQLVAAGHHIEKGHLHGTGQNLINYQLSGSLDHGLHALQDGQGLHVLPVNLLHRNNQQASSFSLYLNFGLALQLLGQSRCMMSPNYMLIFTTASMTAYSLCGSMDMYGSENKIGARGVEKQGHELGATFQSRAHTLVAKFIDYKYDTGDELNITFPRSQDIINQAQTVLICVLLPRTLLGNIVGRQPDHDLLQQAQCQQGPQWVPLGHGHTHHQGYHRQLECFIHYELAVLHYHHELGVGEQAVSDDGQLLSHEEWHNLQDTQGHCDHPHLVTIRTKANSNDQFHLVGQSEHGHCQHHQLLLDGGEHSQQPMHPLGFKYLLQIPHYGPMITQAEYTQLQPPEVGSQLDFPTTPTNAGNLALQLERAVFGQRHGLNTQGSVNLSIFKLYQQASPWLVHTNFLALISLRKPGVTTPWIHFIISITDVWPNNNELRFEVTHILHLSNLKMERCIMDPSPLLLLQHLPHLVGPHLHQHPHENNSPSGRVHVVKLLHVEVSKISSQD